MKWLVEKCEQDLNIKHSKVQHRSALILDSTDTSSIKYSTVVRCIHKSQVSKPIHKMCSINQFFIILTLKKQFYG